MKLYELSVIFKPDLTEKERDAIMDELSLDIDNRQVIGTRLLAYPIKKNKEGYYIFYDVKLDGKNIKKLEQSLNREESIIRYLLIDKEGA